MIASFVFRTGLFVVCQRFVASNSSAFEQRTKTPPFHAPIADASPHVTCSKPKHVEMRARAQQMLLDGIMVVTTFAFQFFLFACQRASAVLIECWIPSPCTYSK